MFSNNIFVCILPCSFLIQNNSETKTLSQQPSDVSEEEINKRRVFATSQIGHLKVSIDERITSRYSCDVNIMPY